jgi:hypothetical protein
MTDEGSWILLFKWGLAAAARVASMHTLQVADAACIPLIALGCILKQENF